MKDLFRATPFLVTFLGLLFLLQPAGVGYSTSLEIKDDLENLNSNFIAGRRIRFRLRPGERHTRVQPSAIRSVLSRFRPRTIKIGSTEFTIGSHEMRHILEQHHPRYYNNDNINKKTETFFRRDMTPDSIADTIESILRDPRYTQEALKLPVGKVNKIDVMHRERVGNRIIEIPYCLGVSTLKYTSHPARRLNVIQFYPRAEGLTNCNRL